MVEMMIRKLIITAHILIAAAALSPAAAQQVKARIAGLENDARYMSLLQDDAALQHSEDSLSAVANKLRSDLRMNRAVEGGADRILSLESRIFDIRNRRGRISAEINMIEQNWVLSSIDSRMSSDVAAPAVEEHHHTERRRAAVRNLIYNDIFARTLPAADYEALKRSQHRERMALGLAAVYRVICDSLADLSASYAVAEDETTGIPLYESYVELSRFAGMIADSLAAEWNYVHDNRSFAYGYLLEQLDREDLIDTGERKFAARRAQAAADYGKYASDVLTDFCTQRAAMVEYERAIADGLKLTEASDSLRAVPTDGPQYDYRLRGTEIVERQFLDYSPVGFPSTQLYNARNPIPECRVYERGTIYRILVGTFWSKQAVATFHGAAPLGFLQMNGKHLYFAGGYRTRHESEAAVAELKRAGFKNPVVVVWRDGKYRNLATDPEPESEIKYRLEIAGAQSLSDQMRAIIGEKAPDCELTRAGGTFILGLFDELQSARQTMDALRLADGSLDIRITEVSSGEAD